MSLACPCAELEPYQVAQDGRQGWKVGLCGRPYCRRRAQWVFRDRGGARRTLCATHAQARCGGVR